MTSSGTQITSPNQATESDRRPPLRSSARQNSSKYTKSFQDLKITGLDTEHSHAIAGAMVRVYFRLSDPPPLGWSYVFATTWSTVDYPLKRPAGVESGTIWIDCIPEEIATHHFEQLQSAVARTNATYRDGARQQAIIASRQAELGAQLRSKLQDVSRTLYPVDGAVAGSAPPRYWGRAFLAKVRRFLFPSMRRKSDA